jgi:hypothetical protein
VLIITAENLLLVCIFLRMTFYLRTNESFAIVIEMVCKCNEKTFAFLVFFYMTVALFALLLMNSMAEIDEKDQEDYAGLPKFFVYLFATYRNSLGDV